MVNKNKQIRYLKNLRYLKNSVKKIIYVPKILAPVKRSYKYRKLQVRASVNQIRLLLFDEWGERRCIKPSLAGGESPNRLDRSKLPVRFFKLQLHVSICYLISISRFWSFLDRWRPNLALKLLLIPWVHAMGAR